ncbi:asparagine synthase (glutamine-hydrolyzing) [Luteibaculum oceani]|uniref:asparagine synthase (glutamine-hydrolyzing) n=1 Tax=Luteibaculum oceani TaxID=1294296 RepID=A0A5C6V866_9FLAO|nr:asparagine synthase (glutamine-hydrolyzing) [Luteibaculum oceani]TXC81532.1 asparagine synthase (glutamine-hydrolyzing) [Luteibaculum oceani]
MCGITGFISQHNTESKHQIVESMMQVIEHRGPDGSGKFVDEHIALGHRRLAIIDIDNGAQPFYSADGRYVIVFNGEIYNYVELRQGLISKGFKLKTYSDTEVLLYTYLDRGADMLNLVNGMFAFAIYDTQSKETFIARDHFGVKPFYYHQSKDHFVFGSEIKSILQYPEYKKEINHQALYEYLTFQFVLRESTLFGGVKKLEPGHYMRVNGRGEITELKKYWDASYRVNTEKSKDEYADELLMLIENSLSIQVRSDVPVGAYLSGGIDSSTIAVMAAKNYYGELKTFTGGFKDNGPYDESNFARIVSQKIKSDHKEIFPNASDFIDNISKLIYHMDEPGGGPGLFPQYMVSKLASDHVKVVLGGQGGDEIFGGYTRYAVAYLEQCLKGAIFETQEEGQHVVTLNSIIANLPSLRQYVPMIKSQFSSGLFEDMDHRYFHLVDRSPSLHKIYQGEFLAGRNEEQIFGNFQEVFNGAASSSFFNKMTYFDMKTLLPTLLQVEDRMSMAVSLESRVPLLDRRIVELATQMPPTMKFSGGKTKHMLIEAVKNILPKEIVERKDKMGFPVPFNEWMQTGDLKGFVKDIFDSQKARSRGIFDVDGLLKQIDESSKFSRDIWGALNVELWLQNFHDA